MVSSSSNVHRAPSHDVNYPHFNPTTTTLTTVTTTVATAGIVAFLSAPGVATAASQSAFLTTAPWFVVVVGGWVVLQSFGGVVEDFAQTSTS